MKKYLYIVVPICLSILVSGVLKINIDSFIDAKVISQTNDTYTIRPGIKLDYFWADFKIDIESGFYEVTDVTGEVIESATDENLKPGDVIYLDFEKRVLYSYQRKTQIEVKPYTDFKTMEFGEFLTSDEEIAKITSATINKEFMDILYDQRHELKFYYKGKEIDFSIVKGEDENVYDAELGMYDIKVIDEGDSDYLDFQEPIIIQRNGDYE